MKKHRKDRDLKKHKNRLRYTSVKHSGKNFDVNNDDNSSSHDSYGQKLKYPARLRSPIKQALVTEYHNRNRINDKHYRHKKNKDHKERVVRTKNISSKDQCSVSTDSDGSDVVEVMITPPAPVISKQIDDNTLSMLKTKKNREVSPLLNEGIGDSLSVEETNKLRAKLGLRPLEIDAKYITTKPNKEGDNPLKENHFATYKDDWGKFVHKPATSLKEEIQADKIREKIKQVKEKRAIADKLATIKALGESDDDVDDVHNWLERTRKLDELRKQAEKREKILQEMDDEFGLDKENPEFMESNDHNKYSTCDLKGLRVEHDINEFSEGNTMILTLKDKEILNDCDDMLVNVNLVDEENYLKNVNNQKQKLSIFGYNAYDENVDEYGQPIDYGILAKYNDKIDELKKKSFILGENLEQQRSEKIKLLEIKNKLAGRRLETLNETMLVPASDTYTELELEKFNKPKKKVRKLCHKIKSEDLFPFLNLNNKKSDLGRRDNSLNTTASPTSNKTKFVDKTYVKMIEHEDDDLENALSKARKLKQLVSVTTKPLSFDIDRIKNEVGMDFDEPNAGMNSILKDKYITMNETAEFCRTLGDIPTYGMSGNRDQDVNDMDYDYETPEQEISYNNLEENTGTWNKVNMENTKHFDDSVMNIPETAILDEEPDVGLGVAAALKLAVSKGYLEKEDKNRPSTSRMAHLQAQNYSIEDKSYADDDKVGVRRDRYHSGIVTDFHDKDGYKPNVKLDYIDDNGRILNAKEAFRYLSHKFHGKGSGKNKMEKRLKKFEQETLMNKMSSTDTPLGTLSMLQQKQKETNTPYILLSGNKLNPTGTSSISKQK